MSCKEDNPKIYKSVVEYETETNEVAQNLLKELKKEQSRLNGDFPICALLIDEAFDCYYSTGLLPGRVSYADVFKQRIMKLTQRVFVPVKEYPILNLTDKILGANENSLTHLQDKTQCKISLKGRNSMLDKDKEEELRQSGNPRFRHLNKDTFLEISTEATPAECYTRIAYALTEIRNYLVCDTSDDVLNEPLCDVTYIDADEIENRNLGEQVVNDRSLQKVFKESHLTPPLLEKLQKSVDKSLDISLADKLIKLLDETVLNPDFQHSKEKNMVSNNLNILNSCDVSKIPLNLIPVASSSGLNNKLIHTTVSLSKNRSQSKNKAMGTTKKRTIKRKLTKKSSISNNVENRNEKTRIIKKKYVRRPFKRMDRFPGIFYLKDMKSNKIIKRKILSKTSLSRCLQRSCKENLEATELDEEVVYKPFTIEYLQRTPTELVFEYTPREIILSLLEAMKNHPVLWEFHDKPFNESYIKAIETLCQKINVERSLSIDFLKMCRSINRVLRFYRYLFPFETIENFSDYFDKCALFLPSNVVSIPHARCSHCFICYKEDAELRKHLKEVHKTLKWPHKCQHCAESFKESDAYEFHKRLPHYVEIFTCAQCNERFNHLNEYSQHLGKHQQKVIEVPKNHVCEECGKKFKNTSLLRSHKYLHGEKKFKCHLCPKSYFKSTGLSVHLKKHRKEYDSICDVCGMAFVNQAKLRAHMEKHTGFKITCNICNLQVRKCNLYRHLRTVHVAVEGTIESTFRAKSHQYNLHKEFKKRDFSPKTERNRRSDEKFPRQYFCKLCNIHFDGLKYLKDHNKQFHSDAHKVSCKMCDSQLANKQNLQRHYQNVHKLHDYQIFAIFERNENINKVLEMKREEFEEIIEREKAIKSNPPMKENQPEHIECDTSTMQDAVDVKAADKFKVENSIKFFF